MGWEAQVIEDAKAVERVTDDQAREASEQADAAERAVVELEAKVVDGDDSVTYDQIQDARGKAQYARLHAAGVARKAERAREAETILERAKLRQEIEENADDLGVNLAQALRELESAARKFFKAESKRYETVQDWQRRLSALGIRMVSRHQHPDDASVGLGLTEGGHIMVGKRFITHRVLHGAELIAREVVSRAQETSRGHQWLRPDPVQAMLTRLGLDADSR